MTKLNSVIFNDMKAEDFFKNKTVSYWDSHQFDNALTEEGEYMEINDVKEYAKLYHQEQIKNNVDLANVSKAFTCEQVIKFLKNEEHLDDAIQFFESQK